jgi:hypothetical protein
MKKYCIDLSSLTPRGKAEMKIADKALDVWTTHSVTPTAFNLYGDSYKRHYVSLPGKYHLPFRLDMTVRLDFPALFLFIGDGHIMFASSGQDNRKIEDIAKPSGKPNQDHYSYDNSLPFNEFVDISVTYGFDEMQILIGGEERFYSRRQAYMKAKGLNERNAEGFSVRLAVSKLSTLNIKTITVTEFDDRAAMVRGAFEEVKSQPAAGECPKPTFESVISGLPQNFRDEIMETDGFLMSLRPMKFKRTVDKGGGKITYVASDFGISYAVNVSGTQSSHNLGWYIVYNGKPETWHRKADYMEETLAEIAKIDPRLSERVFYALNDCVGCYGPGCLARTLYAFNGQKQLSCHGRVVLRMCHDDFQDAREFFRHLNALMERKIANADLPQEKILLMKSKG